jgi:peptidyl-prolyl cis-trans isomerase SurA
MNKTYAPVTLALLIPVFLLAPAIVGADIIEQILVKVNGEIFTKTDLETRQVAALRQRNVQGEQNDEQLRQALGQITPQLMVEAVSEMLLVQRAKELGYKMSDEQFTMAVDNIKKEYKLDTDEKFQAALKQENMSMPDLRRQFERSMMVQKVEQAEVFGKIAISEDEARKYYQEHLGEFTTPAAVTMREILVALPNDGKGATPAQDEAAKGKAGQLRTRALAGDNFMKLAEENSDAPSKANAGLIGPLSLSDLSPDLRKIIESAKAGDVTMPIRTSRGYQFFKIESLTTAETLPFEQAREQINDRVFTGKRNPPSNNRYGRKVQERSPWTMRYPRQTSRSSLRRRRTGTRSGPARATSRRSAINWSESTSRRFCPRSPGGAAGRTERRRSTGRYSPATASCVSTPSTRYPF